MVGHCLEQVVIVYPFLAGNFLAANLLVEYRLPDIATDRCAQFGYQLGRGSFCAKIEKKPRRKRIHLFSGLYKHTATVNN